MDMPLLTGFVFGRLWAGQRNVLSPAAQNRAGVLMAIGAKTSPAMGLVLANESISDAAKGPPPSPATGGTGAPAPGAGTPASGGAGSTTTTPTNQTVSVSLDQTTTKMIRSAVQEVGKAAKAVETAAKAQATSATAAMRMLGQGGSGGNRSRAQPQQTAE